MLVTPSEFAVVLIVLVRIKIKHRLSFIGGMKLK